MRNIEFVNKTLALGVKRLANGEWVDVTDLVRSCDHSLKLKSGFPSDLICCEKCGWNTMVPAGTNISKQQMEQYEIKDMRGIP